MRDYEQKGHRSTPANALQYFSEDTTYTLVDWSVLRLGTYRYITLLITTSSVKKVRFSLTNKVQNVRIQCYVLLLVGAHRTRCGRNRAPAVLLYFDQVRLDQELSLGQLSDLFQVLRGIQSFRVQGPIQTI